MHMLTPSKIAAYRDERLCHVANGTVIRELASISEFENDLRKDRQMQGNQVWTQAFIDGRAGT